MKTLAEYRKALNFSQAELAIELNKRHICVSSASIAMYETGHRTPPLEKAQAIARFFGVATDDIFFGPIAHLERAEPAAEPTGTDG
ncbi:MAG TPA: transcriptional regulator [Pelotomaculum sp.]|nr:transcriptional regulator [Pelotomaculum sp.]